MLSSSLSFGSILVFTLLSLVTHTLEVVLLLTVISMNCFVILSLVIGWISADLGSSYAIQFVKSKIRSKARFIQKRLIEPDQPEFSTFQHYSITERRARFTVG